jgi:hypothetical protein
MAVGKGVAKSAATDSGRLADVAVGAAATRCHPGARQLVAERAPEGGRARR